MDHNLGEDLLTILARLDNGRFGNHFESFMVAGGVGRLVDSCESSLYYKAQWIDQLQYREDEIRVREGEGERTGVTHLS